MIITNFNQRLGETISWCFSQEIISEPNEDESIRHRRMISRKSAELIGKAYRMLAPYERAGWISRWLAKGKTRQGAEIRREGEQLMAMADARSIVPPLRNQLRNEALRPFAQSLAKSSADDAAIVDQVAEVRSQIMRESAKQPDSESFGLIGGRLLAFAPEDNLSDGA